jgi:hypothetical protein
VRFAPHQKIPKTLSRQHKRSPSMTLLTAVSCLLSPVSCTI